MLEPTGDQGWVTEGDPPPPCAAAAVQAVAARLREAQRNTPSPNLRGCYAPNAHANPPADRIARNRAQDIVLQVGLGLPNLLVLDVCALSTESLLAAWAHLPPETRTAALTMLAPYIEAGHSVRQALIAAELLVPPVVAEDLASSGRVGFAVCDATDAELALAGGGC